MVYEADGKGAKLFKTLCRYNNKAFLEGLRFRLFKLFPEKSKYECELPVFLSLKKAAVHCPGGLS